MDINNPKFDRRAYTNQKFQVCWGTKIGYYCTCDICFKSLLSEHFLKADAAVTLHKNKKIDYTKSDPNPNFNLNLNPNPNPRPKPNPNVD